MNEYEKIVPLSLDQVQTYSLKDRHSKVTHTDFAQPWRPGGSFQDYLNTLPKILAGLDIRKIAAAWVQARRQDHLVLLGFGAHVLKVGLSPLIIDLMHRSLISAVALNGAGIIHDAEIAMVGRTSEEVEAVIGAGQFGMAEETAVFLNRAISWGVDQGLGLGEAVGRRLLEADFPHNHLSVLAQAAASGIPATIHVAVGTDIIHMHPSVDPAALGQATHQDFRVFAALVSRLAGGVYLNLGSAVILPEVFLKALSLARNLGSPVTPLTTVNLDFIQHYRPLTNVVRRPTQGSGQGFALTGHHEILFPLLAAMVVEECSEATARKNLPRDNTSPI
ncbi:hypothetical protein [Desulfobacca acetoxidans]|uniref:Deoxyhypusine synthase n=1 Tax=Desulfobacca acetoxidans (strain ATCC 700848 / DSM 11109 / ASRB2) TaxID=880072 RepID=F2ND80_DESAR|nr:hypothetical protein [Desulfobacca acetoxidans]AEB09804.1 hypothetical protein Desac_1971 [Desulfobacca acetoxidans DSM 11109]